MRMRKRTIAIVGGATTAALLTTSVALAATSDDGRLSGLLDSLVEGGVLDEADRAEAEELLDDYVTEQRAERQEQFEERQAEREALLAELGVTEDELREGFQDGTPLGEMVDDVDAARELLVEQSTERLDAALESGRIDQEKYDELIAEIPEQVDAILAGERPFFGGGKPGPGHRGPGHHHLNDPA